MALIGYARVSTDDQDLALQLDALAGHKPLESHGAPARATVDMLNKPGGLRTSPLANQQPASAPLTEGLAA